MSDYTKMEFPIAPWDPPNMPQRTMKERCLRHHGLCAYRDDDPSRCLRCHNLLAKVASMQLSEIHCPECKAWAQ